MLVLRAWSLERIAAIEKHLGLDEKIAAGRPIGGLAPTGDGPL
jgi:hypothetical protein